MLLEVGTDGPDGTDLIGTPRYLIVHRRMLDVLAGGAPLDSKL